MKKDTRIKIYVVVLIAVMAAIAGSYDLWARPDMTLLQEAGGDMLPENVSLAGSSVAGSAAADKAPGFSFTTPDGRERQLADLQEPVILLHFWASWCAPCVAEFPDLYDLVERHEGRVALLAVSMDDAPEDIERFLSRLEKAGKLKIETPHIYIVWDKAQEISRGMFGVAKVPETIFIGPQRRMRTKMVGEVDWLGQDVAQTIRAVKRSQAGY